MYVFGIDIPIMELLFFVGLVYFVSLVIIWLEIRKLRKLLLTEEKDIGRFEKDIKTEEDDISKLEEDISKFNKKRKKTKTR